MHAVTRSIIITSPKGDQTITLVTPVVEVNLSRTTLTNTATVKMARNVNVLLANGTKGDITQVLQRGSAISIWMGYDGVNTERFRGYVTAIDARVPVTISCQDEMWNLKQAPKKYSFNPGATLANIIKTIYTGPAQVANLTMGGFVIHNKSAAQVLDELKKNYGLQCYFQNGVLIVDFAGVLHGVYNNVYLDFNKYVISNNLEYKRQTDVRIKVRGVSKQPDGSQIEITQGDADGEEHTLNYTGMKASELQKLVTADLETMKHDGFSGDFTTYGWPIINPGDVVVFADKLYPEHNGSFLVNAVTITDDAGLRQKVTLERKVAL